MRDIGEGATVHEGGGVLERLHQIGLEGILEEHRHGAIGIEVAGADGLLVAVVGDDDVAEAFLEVLERGREAEDRHNLRGHDDVEAVLTRVAIGRTPQADDDVAQRAVVHVHDALPRDATHIDAEGVAMVDVVVHERCEEVVGQPDGTEVTGEVEVDVLHGHHLGVSAACGPALHAEDRPEGGLAQADHRVLADAAQAIAEADRRGRLAFAGWCRTDGGHEDEVRAGPLGERVEPGIGHLGLVVAVGFQGLLRDAEGGGHLGDGFHLRGLSDLDVGGHCYPFAARTASTSAGMTVAASPMTA